MLLVVVHCVAECVCDRVKYRRLPAVSYSRLEVREGGRGGGVGEWVSERVS